MVLIGLLLMLAGFLGSPLWLWMTIGGAAALAAVVRSTQPSFGELNSALHQAISDNQPA